MKFSVGWDSWVGIGIRDMDQSNFTVNMGRNQVGVISNIVVSFDLVDVNFTSWETKRTCRVIKFLLCRVV